MRFYHGEPTNFCNYLDDYIQGGITELENARIDIILSEEEIFNIVKIMHPNKAPELDGMPGLFYQFYWTIVGGDLVTTIQNV